ncbi:MAG: type II toxin-antitoxin system VapC family toxin [Blastochloris sp.]|nr:type II toxin-antitoxin system VapC family toxin [Blastochloris sp.]
MAIVVDTSVVVAVILNEVTKHELVRLTMGTELIAPSSLHWEIGNALSAMLKRSRITIVEAQQALIEYQKIPLRFLDVSLDESVTIAHLYTIYAYDAYFIVCARTHSSPLLTIDNGLKTVAQAAGITTIEVNP